MRVEPRAYADGQGRHSALVGYCKSVSLMSYVPDGRSRNAIAYHWSSRIISVSIEMVLPGVLGHWLDQRFGTRVLFTILGFGFGLVLGMYHLIQISRTMNNNPSGSPRDEANETTPREGS